MNTINAIAQVVSPLTGASPTSQATRRDKLPSDRQDVPDVSAQSKVENIENKEEAVEANPEELQQTVKSLNDFASNLSRNLQFSVDQDLDRTVIRVVDTETKQVIRQIPSEEVLSLARHTQSEVSAILDVLA